MRNRERETNIVSSNCLESSESPFIPLCITIMLFRVLRGTVCLTKPRHLLPSLHEVGVVEALCEGGCFKTSSMTPAPPTSLD